MATAVLLLVSTSRLTRLFGHPSRLDEVVRSSLVETLTVRFDEMARRYADTRKGLDELLASESAPRTSRSGESTLKVPVPKAGRIVRAIKPKGVRQAIASLGLPAIGRGSADRGPADDYVAARILLDIRPGDRTRLGDTAFRVVTSARLEAATTGRIVRLLQSSIELEAPGAVTPYEETEHEIAALKDAIGTNLRSGALATAERGLELLGHVVRGVWIIEHEHSVASRRASPAQRGGLLQSLVEVEQDLLLSPQVAQVFLDAATTRALEAPGTGSAEYVDECLRSFTRQWSDILRNGGPEFDALLPRIVACVQNLTTYSDPSASEGLRSRGIWAMVELVKLALDAGRPEIAKSAAEELHRLFESDPEGPARCEVRAGLLVLSGWLQYLAGTNDQRYPADPGLEAILVSDGSWRDILAARDVVQAGTPFSRWDLWETNSSASGSVGSDELLDLIDRAQLTALAGSSGTEAAREGLPAEGLEAAISSWDSAQNDRSLREPVPASRTESLASALRDALNARERVSEQLPADSEVPASAPDSLPILGMSFRIPRRSFAGEVTEQTSAETEALGRMIADGFTEAEDRTVIAELRSLHSEVLDPTAPGVRDVLEALRGAARHFVLLVPYGGYEGLTRGYPDDVADAVSRVTCIETGALDDEAILFDRRTTLRSFRAPEEGEGISPVEGTAIALGFFEDVDGSVVRIEAGERFLIWQAEDPCVFRFGAGSDRLQRR
ncbi:hypothetical protein ACFQ9V_08845 [Leifsonia sp. NPDC056665]|uniref:hypothetical protein n=1 Tax=Leifsonia sp. NPDC056665 TaxID=3345901 RepID=UPI0036B723F9